MSIRDEYFTAFCGGKEECLCRIILPLEEGKSASTVFDELYDRVRTTCETGVLIQKHGWDRDEIKRFSVTPYRYLCRGTLYRVDDEIISCKIEASLDARFPGGVHLLEIDGFLYDEKVGMMIPAEVFLPSDIRRALKGKGRVYTSYADGEGIHFLLSDGSECLCSTEGFIRSYQNVRKHILRTRKKEKKGIDKRRKL